MQKQNRKYQDKLWLRNSWTDEGREGGGGGRENKKKCDRRLILKTAKMEWTHWQRNRKQQDAILFSRHLTTYRITIMRALVTNAREKGIAMHTPTTRYRSGTHGDGKIIVSWVRNFFSCIFIQTTQIMMMLNHMKMYASVALCVVSARAHAIACAPDRARGRESDEKWY